MRIYRGGSGRSLYQPAPAVDSGHGAGCAHPRASCVVQGRLRL